MSKYLVLSVKSYDFESNTGERVSGAKITYINKKPSSRENELGYPPLIVNVKDNAVIDKINKAPAIYDMDFEQITGKNNKPEIALVDAEPVSEVDMSLIF